MLEMNGFEKKVQEIVEKKEKETDEFFEIVYFLLNSAKTLGTSVVR